MTHQPFEASRNILKTSLSRLVFVSDEEFELFYSRLKFKKLKRRELLLESGKVCSDAFFVIKGLIRYFHVVDGEEITGQFFFEGSWYTDYESFLIGIPSSQNVQALEPCEIAYLSKTVLQELYERIPALEKFGRYMAENAYLGLRKRTETYTLLSAEQRYLALLEQRPKVIARVPQHYIASYLGIKPQSLSRIRRRIVDEQK